MPAMDKQVLQFLVITVPNSSVLSTCDCFGLPAIHQSSRVPLFRVQIPGICCLSSVGFGAVQSLLLEGNSGVWPLDLGRDVSLIIREATLEFRAFTRSLAALFSHLSFCACEKQAPCSYCFACSLLISH